MKKKIDITPNIETLFGTRDENLHVLEDGLNIGIDLRSDSIELEGAARDVARAEQVFFDYDHLQRSGFTLSYGDLNSMRRVLMADPNTTLRGLAEAGRQRSLGRRTVQPKSVNQRRYLEAIEKHDMVFGVGPAGTGKTYLAVAMAISALLGGWPTRLGVAHSIPSCAIEWSQDAADSLSSCNGAAVNDSGALPGCLDLIPWSPGFYWIVTNVRALSGLPRKEKCGGAQVMWSGQFR